MTRTVPPEADWNDAPTLLDGAMNLDLTEDQCDLAYWLSAVAQGTLKDRAEKGYAPAAETPAHMREPGPLRDALIMELGYRSVAEEKATRILAHYVAQAPGLPELEFYTTQLVDEARHSMVFRKHLTDLGMATDGLARAVAEMSADYTKEILEPVEEFAVRTVRDEGDFIGGVAIFTIVIEGVLAPAAELSERKWHRLDPAASEIARGASIDEIRHLTVGSSILRRHLVAHPDYRPRLLDILRRGRQLWDDLPEEAYVMRREHLFQEGMGQHRDLLDDYEVWPGRRLLDTTPAERYATAERWTDEMAVVRLNYMGVPEALPVLGLA
ncbi:VlmB-like protein [Salinispora cortesiana]|uniref:VlmB-like protein n=1 Tax=Salinispora cortesiana TaxID=1305843 RepID=UPI0004103223|nr:VlmB-like protein [Salinispora cortesiana]